MEALSSALAAVHPQLAGHAEGLYGIHLVSADTFVKVAASKQEQKLVEFGLSQKEAERCIDLYSASPSGQHQSLHGPYCSFTNTRVPRACPVMIFWADFW